MNNPKIISLTGIDAHTDLDALGELSMMGPVVEFGVLYLNEKADVNSSRYPDAETREKFLNYRVNGQPLRLAAHLCGRSVFESILDPKRRLAIIEDIKRYDRVQLNVNARTTYFEDCSVEDLFKILNQYGITTILQMHNRSRKIVNKYLDSQSIHGEYKNVNILFDKSGGFGRLPDSWEKPVPYNSTSFYGYAGGLGPDTLGDQIELIREAAGEEPYWIDMESGVRTNDIFDVDKARCVIQMFI